MRRLGVAALAAVLAAAGVGAVSGAGYGPATRSTVDTAAVPVQLQPNVVMIVVDDMREDELRYMPETRRLLGRKGVRFVNSFAPYPLCCPARASMLTGQYTHNHRVYDVNEPYAFPSLKDGSTLATALQDSGYATILLGKYLNGYGYMPEPGAESGNSLHYVPPGWTDWRASIDHGLRRTHPDKGGTYNYFDTTLSDDGQGFHGYEGKYQTYVYGRLSSRIIEQRAAADRPFFLFANYTGPHNGFPVESDDVRSVVNADGESVTVESPARPDQLKGMFDDVIKRAPGADWVDPDRSDQSEYLRSRPPMNQAERQALTDVTRQRAEALAAVDRSVERTVTALRRSGELDDTLLVFTSDNGYFLGEHGIRQGKTLPYEPALNTPLLMRGPGIPSGERRTDPFLQIDFAPTIAELDGASLDLPVDGSSMLDVARNGDVGWSRPVLTETGPKGVIRDTDEAGQPLEPEDPGERDIRWAIGIRTPQYLYVHLASGEEELYDIHQDPEQYDNLVGEPGHGELLEQLRAELARMRACDADQCRQPLPRGLATAPTE